MRSGAKACTFTNEKEKAMLRRSLELVALTIALWSLSLPVHSRIVVRRKFARKGVRAGYCRPPLFMLLKGHRRAVPVGRIIKPNLCVDCKCTSNGSFKCCLSRKNAGKTFVYPGALCTRCKCADLPYSRDFYLPDSVLEQHCFRGNSLMTCESNLCIHPLAADPNCIEVKKSQKECCDRCIRSGCYVMLNGTKMEPQNNQLAIDNYESEGVFMIKLGFGESIQEGCIRGTCHPPDFMFSGGFETDNSSCVAEQHGLSPFYHPPF